MEGLYIGIDFGTSTNFVTKWDFKKKTAVPIENLSGEHGGNNFFENVIYYESETNLILGKNAIKKGVSDSNNLVRHIKRKITEDGWKIKINSLNKELTAKDVTRDIFRKIKDDVSQIEGGKVINGAVISIPFAYGHVERELIKSAAIEAGLNVLGLIEEPVAAALAFGLLNNENLDDKKNILVFDFGGGTLDITIFESFKKENSLNIEVINTDGDKALGGIDIDQMLYNVFLKKLPYNIEDIEDKKNKAMDIKKICSEAKELKESLSEEDEGDVIITGLYDGNILEIEDFTREQLNELLKKSFMKKVLDILENTLDDVEFEAKDIDEIVLVGGTSKIPYIQEELEKYLGKKIEVLDNIEELVGLGAGVYCGKLIDNSLNLKVIKKLSHYIGLSENGHFRTLIEKNARYKEFSGKQEFKLKNSNDNLRLKIYEGTSKKVKDCSVIGNIEIKASDFKEKVFRIKLGTDRDGIIMYKLLNTSDKLIKEGELSSNL